MKALTVKIDVVGDFADLMVTGFETIGSFNITLNYDATAIEVTPPAMLECKTGNLANGQAPGILKFGWFMYPSVTLPDNSVLLKIGIKRLKAVTSEITFAEDAGFYFDGFATQPETTYISGVVNDQPQVEALPTFAKKAKVADKKKAMGYKGTQPKKPAKRCGNCQRCNVKKCIVGCFVIAANGICNFHK